MRNLLFLLVFLFPASLMAQLVAVDPVSAIPDECRDESGFPMCVRLNHGETVRITVSGSCTEIFNPTDKDIFIPMRNGTGDYLAFLDNAEAAHLGRRLCVACPPRCAQPQKPH